MISIVSIIFMVMFGILYFLPTFVASQNKKTDIVAIWLLNLFMGWTFVGWVIALVWAFTKNNK